jgi:predicted house-cleaning noncanonical NTP pyrophosphatase (MazG superfamily)
MYVIEFSQEHQAHRRIIKIGERAIVAKDLADLFFRMKKAFLVKIIKRKGRSICPHAAFESELKDNLNFALKEKYSEIGVSDEARISSQYDLVERLIRTEIVLKNLRDDTTEFIQRIDVENSINYMRKNPNRCKILSDKLWNKLIE